MGMSREKSAFPLGSLVLVTRGHHSGSVFVVIGIECNSGKNDRILIADGRYISVRKPKRKNPLHIVKTGIVFNEVEARLAGGKNIDDGWLVNTVSSQKNEISRLILEEVGQSICRKMMP
jgi:hypothetical protein